MKKHIIRLVCGFCIWVWWAGSPPARALDPDKAVTQYSLDVWQLEDGLPQSSILDIVQTRDGFLWFATYEGVTRFDGKTFARLTAPQTQPVRDQHILVLAEGGGGELWLGTQNGAHRLDGDDLISVTVDDGLRSNTVQAIQEDRADRVWLGTQAGLSLWEDGRVTATYTEADGLAHADVRALLEDRRGRLWIGTQKGLSASRGDGFETVEAAGRSLGEVVCLLEDLGGSLWVGTQGNGLFRFQDGAFSEHTTHEGLASDFVSALFEDRHGNLWVGSQDRGLSRRSSDGGFERFSSEQGLSDDHVRAILEDHEGSLWIGTFSGGLNRLKDGKFTPLTTWQGLADDLVLPILESRSGDLWFGTQAGLSRLRNGSIETYDKSDGLGHDFVWALAETHSEDLWIGTWGGGISRLSNGQITTLTTADGLAHNDVRAILETRSEDLWIGTWGGGLNRLHDGRLTSITTAEGLGSNFVTSLFEDREGILWIGTNGGLSELRDGEISTLTTADGLAHNVVLSFHQDQEGSLWIGTEGGLNRLRNGEMTSFTTADGLFNNRFFQILEDRQGNLWTACNQGIFRIAKQQLEDLAAGRIEAVESISYGTADGMLSHECNGGFQPAGWQTRDGILWFPTIRGAVSIDPDNVETNPTPPPVVIEQLIADKKSLAHGADAVLPLVLEGRDFEIHYTALSFLDPDKVEFRYRLEGYETQWVDAGSRRVAFYTNIPPGRYRFHVKASNNDGLWNETGDSLSIYRRPAFYERWSFILACAVAVAGLGWGAYSLRVRRLLRRHLELQAMHRELEEKSAEIRIKSEELSRFTYTVSHDLKGPLVTIQGFLGFMEKDLAQLDGDTSRARSDIERIKAAAASMTNLLNELLELSRIGRLDNPHQRVSLYDIAREVLDLLAGQVAAKDAEAVVTPNLPVVVGDRPRLLAVFQNLIDNAIKFCDAGQRPRIEIGVADEKPRQPGETPVCFVRDNGKGIDPRYHEKVFQLFDQLDPEAEGTGAGLAIVQRIIERHGGRIWVESEGLGQGATFYFTFAEKAV